MSVENRGNMGVCSKRRKRWASKKRKLESFLALIANEETKFPKLENPPDGEVTEETMKQMRQVSSNVRNNKEERPTFYLTEHGLKAQVNFTYYNRDKPLGETIAPLFVLDIQQFLLKALLGNSDYNFRWGKIDSVKKISCLVLFIVDGLSKDMFIQNMSHFPNALQLFPDMVEILTPASYCLNFATELSGVHLTFGYRPSPEEQNDGIGMCTSHHPLTGVFPCPKEPIVIKDFHNTNKTFSKLHLLLNPLQLAMENFPLPDSILDGSDTSNYCFTKNVYAHVTPDSPLFALDCEMCRMKSGKSEVIRISLVDESLNVVYSTLVKPKGHVADYLTKFSGVNREMLLPIKITLTDVQKKLQRLLPPDAILCGQSLNFDLHALRMIHPYIIDTSVIYNMSGRRTKKASLRVLSDVFLNEVIQDSEKGHDPTEDCVATMKLVQLKLKNGPIFGDAILADCKKNKPVKKMSNGELNLKNGLNKKEESIDNIETSKIKEESSNNREIPKLKEVLNNTELFEIKNEDNMKTPVINKVLDNTNLPINNCNSDSELSVRFFSKLQNAGKKLCIVADSISYPQYPINMVTSSIKKVVETSMKKVVKSSIKVIEENHLTVCHITPLFNQEDITELSANIDKFIKKLFNACTDKSLFITVATGASKKDVNFENGLCMIRVKNENV